MSTSIRVHGCDPWGWDRYRGSKEPKGRVQGTNRAIFIGKTKMHPYRPVILCEVDTRTARSRRAFKRFCRLNRVEAKIPQGSDSSADRWTDSEGRTYTTLNVIPSGAFTVYECTGGLALEDLSISWFVNRWWFPLALS